MAGDGHTERPPTPYFRYRMVRSDPYFGIHIAVTNPLLVKDISAFLIIVYSGRHRGLSCFSGVPSILDKIVRDSTIYFLVLFTSHSLTVLFLFVAPVSDPSTALFSPLMTSCI